MSRGEKSFLTVFEWQAEMLTFTADKRGFKLRHVINMAPTTCTRVSQMRRKAVGGKQREREGEKKRQISSALTSKFRGSNIKRLGLLFLPQPPVLSFQEANDNDRNEDKD